MPSEQWARLFIMNNAKKLYDTIVPVFMFGSSRGFTLRITWHCSTINSCWPHAPVGVASSNVAGRSDHLGGLQLAHIYSARTWGFLSLSCVFGTSRLVRYFVNSYIARLHSNHSRSAGCPD